MKMTFPIVIIDDEDLIREGLRQFLEWEGYTVFTANNGQKGLDLIRKNQGASLIVVDLQMPVMSGEQFLTALKAEENPAIKNAPVLLLTARSQISAHEGVAGIVRKPLDLEDFLSTVKRLCPSD